MKHLKTEYHCHILPQIDDGSKSVDMSLGMIKMMQEQGIQRICATPHFYAHRWESIDQYLGVRQHAFDKLRAAAGDDLPPIYLGAEVSIEHGISELPGIEKLAIQGTSLILLELQYKPYERWMSEEIDNISAEFGLTVILAHVHRYLDDYTKDQIETVLNTDAILQANNEAWKSYREKKLVKRIIKDGCRLCFGSDAHNLGERKPNWDLAAKKCPADALKESDKWFDRYRL